MQLPTHHSYSAGADWGALGSGRRTNSEAVTCIQLLRQTHRRENRAQLLCEPGLRHHLGIWLTEKDARPRTTDG